MAGIGPLPGHGGGAFAPRPFGGRGPTLPGLSNPPTHLGGIEQANFGGSSSRPQSSGGPPPPLFGSGVAGFGGGGLPPPPQGGHSPPGFRGDDGGPSFGVAGCRHDTSASFGSVPRPSVPAFNGMPPPPGSIGMSPRGGSGTPRSGGGGGGASPRGTPRSRHSLGARAVGVTQSNCGGVSQRGVSPREGISRGASPRGISPRGVAAGVSPRCTSPRGVSPRGGVSETLGPAAAAAAAAAASSAVVSGGCGFGMPPMSDGMVGGDAAFNGSDDVAGQPQAPSTAEAATGNDGNGAEGPATSTSNVSNKTAGAKEFSYRSRTDIPTKESVSDPSPSSAPLADIELGDGFVVGWETFYLKKPDALCQSFMTTLCCAMIFMIVGFALLGVHLGGRSKTQTLECTVRATRVDPMPLEWRRSDNSNRFRPIIEVQLEGELSVRSATRYGGGSHYGMATRADCQRYLERFPVGYLVTCYQFEDGTVKVDKGEEIGAELPVSIVLLVFTVVLAIISVVLLWMKATGRDWKLNRGVSGDLKGTLAEQKQHEKQQLQQQQQENHQQHEEWQEQQRKLTQERLLVAQMQHGRYGNPSGFMPGGIGESSSQVQAPPGFPSRCGPMAPLSFPPPRFPPMGGPVIASGSTMPSPGPVALTSSCGLQSPFNIGGGGPPAEPPRPSTLPSASTGPLPVIPPKA
eukprot:TRINITY_DN49118_c0_g1_i1.p1 TRINITY_DN49118_c0_g1~~TRINITY_DN49118_c0_g1_i1.p1  ORF type:complete len:687 (+),score=117.50 TRINITY_DN49118_c0_g1_i1:43-2103(+)